MMRGRQLHQSFGLQLAEQISTGNFPQPAVGLSPVPNLAQPLGQMRAPAVPFGVNEFTDQAQVFLPNSPPPYDPFLAQEA